MIQCSFNVNINNKQHTIQSSDIELACPRSSAPKDKEETAIEFPALLADPLHQRVDGLKTILNQIDTLEQTTGCEYAKAIAKSLLFSTLFVVCVTSVILVIVINSPEIAVISGVVAFLSVLSCFFLGALYGFDFKSTIESIERADPHYQSPWYFSCLDKSEVILAFICIPLYTFSSLYEVCTRKKRLERVRDTLQQTIETELKAHIEEAIDFFQNKKEQRYETYLAEHLQGYQAVRAAYQAFEHTRTDLVSPVQQEIDILEGNQRDLQKLSQLCARITSP